MGAASLDKLRMPPLDEALRPRWGTAEPLPLVFIMGLHRSGTTVLYEYLSQVLPVAPLTLSDVVFFPRMVHSHIEDEGREDRARLLQYFETHEVFQRALDNIPLSPDTVEEYGWILKREAGSFAVDDASRAVFDDLVRKLSFLYPERSALLLKNPWDTARAPELAAAFTDARFVFLQRDPVEILNSELRNALSFSGEKSPLVQLLTRGMPSVRLFLAAARTVRRVVGQKRAERFLVRWLFQDILNNLGGLQAAIAAVPAHRAVRVSYRGLIEDTRGTLGRVADFLELPLSDEVDGLEARRRTGGAHPLIEGKQAELNERLRQEGFDWAVGT